MDNLFFAVVLEAAYELEETNIGREAFLRKLCHRHGYEYWRDVV